MGTTNPPIVTGTNAGTVASGNDSRIVSSAIATRYRGSPLDSFNFAICGQSNARNFGENGSLVVQNNVLVWNDQTNAFVPAVYGNYPLTDTINGQLCNNQGIEFANRLRLSGILPSSTPIRMFLVSVSGTPIPNWIVLKTNPNTGLVDGQFAFNQLILALTTSNTTHLDTIIWSQGEADSIGSTADAFTGSAYSSWGFGNNAENYAPGATNPVNSILSFSSTVAAAIVAAGGTNTFLGYKAAYIYLIQMFRSLPQVSATMPILVTELSRGYTTSENLRNDVFSQLSGPSSFLGRDSYVRVTSSRGALMSQVAGNGNHFYGTFVTELGDRHFEGWLALTSGSQPYIFPDKQIITITNNQNQFGVQQNITGDSNVYVLSQDELRFGGCAVRIAGTDVLVIPNAGSVIGATDFDLSITSISAGNPVVACLQAITGLNGGVQSALTVNGISTNYWQYTFTATGVYRFNNGFGVWTQIGHPVNSGLTRGIAIAVNTSYLVPLSAALTIGNVLAMSFAINGGSAISVSATYDGTINVNSEATLTAFAASLTTALGTGYSATSIVSTFSIRITTPTGVTFVMTSSSVTGTSPPTIGTMLANTYALTASEYGIGQAIGIGSGMTVILALSNATLQGQIELQASGGGAFKLDCWSNDAYFSGSGTIVFGQSGLGGFTVPVNTNIIAQPNSANRHWFTGGTAFNSSTWGGPGHAGPGTVLTTGTVLTSAQCQNNVYLVAAGAAITLPNPNGNGYWNVMLSAEAGSATISVPGNFIYDRGSLITTFTLPQGLSVVIEGGGISSHAQIVGGSYYAASATAPSAYGLPRGTLGINPNGLKLSGSLIVANVLTINGTVNGTAIAQVQTTFSGSSDSTLAVAATALQTSMNAVLAGFTAIDITGGNSIQTYGPAGATVVLTGVVTLGASQVTATQDTGVYRYTASQCQSAYDVALANTTQMLPTPNAALGSRVAFYADGVSFILDTSAGSIMDRDGTAILPGTAAIVIPVGYTVVLETMSNSRWQITGGTYAVSASLQRKKLTGVIATTSIILPIGASITRIMIQETAGAAITGGLNIGTTTSTHNITSALAVAASSYQSIKEAALLATEFSATATQQIYFSAGSAWNGASINVDVFYVVP